MATVKEELPVLNAVVETGNESIIQSTRLGHEVLAELESLRQGAKPQPGSEGLPQGERLLQGKRHPREGGDGDTESDFASQTGDGITAGKRHPRAGGDGLNFDPTGPVEVNAEFENVQSTAMDAANNSDELDDPLLSEAQPTLFNNQQLEDDEIELMIDDVVDRHITELRKDIKRLLERAKNVP